MKNNKKTFLLKKMDLKRKRVDFAFFAGLCEGKASFGIDYRGKTKPKKSTVPEPPTLKIALVKAKATHVFWQRLCCDVIFNFFRLETFYT